MKKVNKKSLLISLVFIFLGFLIFLYPNISNIIAKFNQTTVIRNYSEFIESMPQNVIDEEYQKAVNYNKELVDSNIQDPFNNKSKENFDKEEYNNILNINKDGVIGYIEIPKINVNLPIYHTTSDDVINKGVGHLEESSFPIGGNSTHAVLTSHTGISKAKLFTDLNKLDSGDVFKITVLNRNVYYKVTEKNVVLPYEVDSLKIKENEDLCTLITCTPYGVNTHRLLVTGKRCEDVQEYKEQVEKISKRKNNICVYIIIMTIVIISLILIIFLIGRLKKNRKESK